MDNAAAPRVSGEAGQDEDTPFPLGWEIIRGSRQDDELFPSEGPLGPLGPPSRGLALGLGEKKRTVSAKQGGFFNPSASLYVEPQANAASCPRFARANHIEEYLGTVSESIIANIHFISTRTSHACMITLFNLSFCSC